jgi:hypothetical protein
MLMAKGRVVNIKKLIAREGLVFLVYLLSLTMVLISEIVFNLSSAAPALFVFVNISYVIYWMIRFIFWAIRTLKQKD